MIRKGDIVNYQGTVDQNYPAIVTTVHDEDCVNLMVMDEIQGPHIITSVMRDPNASGERQLSSFREGSFLG